MNGYIAMFNGKKAEIFAEDLYAAKKQAMSELKVPLSKMGLLGVYLAEKDGKPVKMNPADL